MHQLPEGGIERHDVQLPLVSPLGPSANPDVREYEIILVLVPLGDEPFEEVGGHSHVTNSRTKSLRSPDRKRSIRFSASAASVFSRSSAMPRVLADSSIMSAR